jgi:hypothetical protein
LNSRKFWRKKQMMISPKTTAASFREQYHTTALHIFAEGEVLFGGKGSIPLNHLCRDLAIIDVNGNNRYDQTRIPRGARFTEPCLGTSLKELRRLAELKGTEVLTSDDFDLKVKECGYKSSSFWGDNELFEGKVRDAQTVIEQALPETSTDLKWAVDVVNNEFLIYHSVV